MNRTNGRVDSFNRDGAREGRATLRDVASLANVHISTASRALDPARSHYVSGDARERVVAAANALEYRPNVVARGLRRGSTALLGVAVANLIDDPTVRVLSGIEEEASLAGFSIVLADSHNDFDRLSLQMGDMANRRVDAIVLVTECSGQEVLIERFGRTNTPVVVASDHEADVMGAALAAQHLVQIGHRRIAQLSGPTSVPSFARRSMGFIDALARSPATDVSTRQAPGNVSVDEGRRVMERLLALPVPPTAVVAHDDRLAVGALTAIREAKLDCPEDVSLIGYGDTPLAAHMFPRLTTIRIPGEEIGRRAVRLALAAVTRSETLPSVGALEPWLVRRESTAPCSTPSRAPTAGATHHISSRSPAP